jgi:DNA adenine methylase
MFVMSIIYITYKAFTARCQKKCGTLCTAWKIYLFFILCFPLFDIYFNDVIAPLFVRLKRCSMGRNASEIYLHKDTPIQLPDILTLPPHRKRNLIAFGWYGGKFSHLSWLLPLLAHCNQYCEPFGGSAAVLLNREPSPVETYNDIDGEVVNFFRVLRDKRQELIEAIGLTPFSREEYYLAIEDDEDSISDVERARRFFIRARQTRTGLAQTASLGRWANCRNTSRRGMAGAVSRWLGSIESLPDIALRLLRVQIENRPALEIIKLYDSPDTLFYCDPPYPHESRGDTKSYGFEMTDHEHDALADVLKNIKGKAAVSGYRCDLMDTIYRDFNRHDAPPKICHSVKQIRQETLWVNY